LLDIYAGVDTGTNTGIGRPGDNNGAAAFIAGVGINLFEGKLAVLALTHTGPETPRAFEGLADTDSEARSLRRARHLEDQRRADLDHRAQLREGRRRRG
jgi:hypothetical protein